jgi:hypothetical protein
MRPSPENPPFFGNSWAATGDDARRAGPGGEQVLEPWPDSAQMTPPLCWLPPSVDRSPSSQVYVDHPAWGPLQGTVLGVSYGTGDVYRVLRDTVEDATGVGGGPVQQGGIVKLGLRLPTGLLDGRIHPDTGDLYVAGLFGWSSDQTQPGGFYRVRPRAENWKSTMNVPSGFRAVRDGIELTFMYPLDPATAADPASWQASAWNYLRQSSYGSAMYDLDGNIEAQTAWVVSDASVSEDGRTVRLGIDDFQPAMQVRIGWSIKDAAGRPLDHEAFLTVHAVRE